MKSAIRSFSKLPPAASGAACASSGKTKNLNRRGIRHARRQALPSATTASTSKSSWKTRGISKYRWWATNSRSEEHTSELQSLMRISYAVFCLKTKKKQNTVETKIRINEHNNNKATRRTYPQ